MSNAKRGKGAPHQHKEEQAPQQPQQRRPTSDAIINSLNVRLDEKAQTIRVLEDRLTFHEALRNELEAECSTMAAIVEQLAVESRVLRKRLGLPAQGALELTDEEADGDVPADMVTEEPDDNE